MDRGVVKSYGVVRRVKESLCRIRHFRGHGVHSPFVYSIVRKVFMRRTLIEGSDLTTFDKTSQYTTPKDAIEIQNIATVCGYKKVVVVEKSEQVVDADFVLCIDGAPSLEILQAAQDCGATVAILNPMESEDIDSYIANHRSTIIKKRHYILIFNNHLPKQRYIL